MNVSRSSLNRVQIPISMRAGGTLVTDKKNYPISAMSSARITAVLVAENQQVKKGSSLIETDQQLPPAVQSTLRADALKLRKVIADDAKGKCASECLRSIERLSVTAFGATVASPLSEGLVALRDLLREYAAAKAAEGKNVVLMTEQYRQIRQAQDKIKIIASKSASTLLATDVDALQREIGSAKAQIAERRASSRAAIQQTRDRLEVRLEHFPKDIDDFLQSSAYIAPTDGIVSGLAISGSGQILTNGQKILDLMPVSSTLVAEVAIQNKDIASIATGMEAKVSLEAFPSREYGDIAATVIEIPATIAQATDPKAPSSYKIKLRLSRQAFIKDGHELPFRNGMTLTSTIVMRRERMLKLAVRNAFNLRDDVFN